MTVHTNVQNLLSQYVLNELGSAEKQTVDEHLAQCDECRSELDCMRSVLSIADTMGDVQMNDAQQAVAVSDLQCRMETTPTVRPWWMSKSIGAIAAIVLIGVLLALIFIIWHPGQEKQIVQPQPDPIQQPIDKPIENQFARDQEQDQIVDELAQAKALFEAGNVQALSQLFETGSDETKLAVVNYLNQLDTDQSLKALQLLDMTDAGQDVIDAVNQAVDKVVAPEEPEDIQKSSSEPNSIADAVIESDSETAPGVMIEPGDGADPNEVVDLDNDQDGFIGIKVIAAETGKPIQGASLLFRNDANGREEETLTSDQMGRVLFDLKPEKTDSLDVKITAKGFVSKYLDWRPDSKGIELPKQYLVEMKKSVSIGGFVKTKTGEPIEGVSLNISTEFTPQLTDFDYIQATVKTDKDGQWALEDFDGDASQASISLEHPEYVSVDQYSSQPNIEVLMNQTCVLFMQKGLTVSGYVTTSDGAPVKGATIYQGFIHYAIYPKTQTDEQGFYQFEKCHQGRMILTVVASGYAQDMLNLNLSKDVADADFVLAPGNTLTVRVEDTQGNPIEGATVEGSKWRQYSPSQQCESIRCKAKTDAQGLATLVDLPADEIKYNIRKDGYASYRDHPMTASNQGVVVTMYPKGRLFGKVYDAETNELIKEFKVTKGIHWQGQRGPTWQSRDTMRFSDGTYEQSLYYHTEGFAVKIEAEGYYPYESETFYNESKDITLDIYLQKNPKDALYGVVYDPEGKPAWNAEVLLCLKGEGWLRIHQGRFNQTSSLRLKTNKKGEFILPPQQKEYMIVVLHESGVGRMTEAQLLDTAGQIHLQKWARVEGTVYSGRKPDVNGEIAVQCQYEIGHEYNIIDYTHIYTDDKGHYSFGRVLGGLVTVFKNVEVGDGSSQQVYRTHVEISPGETKEVHLGGGGRTVTGRFRYPSDLNIDLAKNDFEIMPSKSDLQAKGLDLSSLPEVPVPLDYFMQTSEQMQAWQAEWMQTPEGQEYMKLAQKLISGGRSSLRAEYAIVIDEKGNFSIDDVLPGSYTVAGRFRDPAKRQNEGSYYDTYIATVDFDFTVDDTEDPEEFEKPVNIGQFEIRPARNLEVGQPAPEIAMMNFEGQILSLQSFRGKYVLLDLKGSGYLSNQNQEQIVTLKEIYSTYHQQADLNIISLIPGIYPQGWTSIRQAMEYYFDQKGIQWTIAVEDSATLLPSKALKDYTIDGKSPAFVLIAPDGTFLERIDSAANIMETLQRHLSLEEDD